MPAGILNAAVAPTLALFCAAVLVWPLGGLLSEYVQLIATDESTPTLFASLKKRPELQETVPAFRIILYFVLVNPVRKNQGSTIQRESRCIVYYTY